jgi:hypothetical protein
MLGLLQAGCNITPRQWRPTCISELVRQDFAVSFRQSSLYDVLLYILDWLRERVFFEALRKNDQYVISRLGFRAPNIFIMELAN